MQASLLDTDTLTEFLKRRNPNVGLHAAAYLAQHRAFTFSSITRFEVLRGLKAKHAERQIERFTDFCRRSTVLPVTEKVFDRATDLWVLGRQSGHPCQDADLLIAATALEHELVLVTGNTSHFAWIPGLTLADWRQP